MSVDEKREFAMKSMNQFDNFCKTTVDCYSIVIEIIETVLSIEENNEVVEINEVIKIETKE